jgi:hypothetical protein
MEEAGGGWRGGWRRVRGGWRRVRGGERRVEEGGEECSSSADRSMASSRTNDFFRFF